MDQSSQPQEDKPLRKSTKNTVTWSKEKIVRTFSPNEGTQQQQKAEQEAQELAEELAIQQAIAIQQARDKSREVAQQHAQLIAEHKARALALEEEQLSQHEWDLPLIDGRYYDMLAFPGQFSRKEFVEKIHRPAQMEQQRLSQTFQLFAFKPVLGPLTRVGSCAIKLTAERYPDDFVLATSFHPLFLKQLMYFGFLPIGDAYPHRSPDHQYQYEFLLPKLHQRRCVMDWSKFKVHSNLKTKANKFLYTQNAAYGAVIIGCVKQHGDPWLYPTYRKSLVIAHAADNTVDLQLQSVEVWLTYDQIYDYLVEYYTKSLSGTAKNELKPLPKLPQSNSNNNKQSQKGKSSKINQNENIPSADEDDNDDNRTKHDVNKNIKVIEALVDPIELEKQYKLIKLQNLSFLLQRYPPCRTPYTAHLSPLLDNISTIKDPDTIDLTKYFYLVAGEIGYTICDKYYCSMTGFRSPFVDSCGMVQLYTLGTLLRHAGVELWDLGMTMEYKEEMGAVSVPRARFVQYLFENVHENTTKKERKLAMKSNENNTNSSNDNNNNNTNNNNDNASTIMKKDNGSSQQSYIPSRPLPIKKPLFRQVYDDICDETRELKYKQQQNEINTQYNKLINIAEKKIRWLKRKHGDDVDITQYLTQHDKDNSPDNLKQRQQDALQKLKQQYDSNNKNNYNYLSSPGIRLVQIDDFLPCGKLLALQSNVQDFGWFNIKSSMFPAIGKKNQKYPFEMM